MSSPVAGDIVPIHHRVIARLLMIAAVALVASSIVSSVADATPSTTFWAPSTPYVQPYGVAHITYDTYFQPEALFPLDLGLEMGLLRSRGLQAELGFDLLYPSFSGGEALSAPLVLNAKIGAPEDIYFRGQPAWSAGIYGVGFEENVTDYNILHGVLGKTVPTLGALSLGFYYGLNDELLVTAEGKTERSGLMAGWLSPSIDVPKIDKLIFAWDVQSGKNVQGATGGGVYLYFTPAIALLTGPVFFFEEKLQAGQSSQVWSVQLDVDVDLLSGGR